MQIIQTCCGFLLSLLASLLVWGQSLQPSVVDPPRQQMQTVVPNLLAGPYLMNVTGKTFVHDAFLDVAITAKGMSVPDGTTVTFDAVPTKGGDADTVDATPIHATAVTKAGHAKLVPDVAVRGDWDVTLRVAGPAGSVITPAQKVGFDSHSPPASLTYRLTSLAIPVVSVLLLLAFFRLRRIELERLPASRAQTAQWRSRPSSSSTAT